jgi:Flp pilus assembly pilin Flp
MGGTGSTDADPGERPIMDLAVLTVWLRARLGVDTQRGANLVEYVFLLVLIALVVLITVQLFGTSVSHKYSEASVQSGL